MRLWSCLVVIKNQYRCVVDRLHKYAYRSRRPATGLQVRTIAGLITRLDVDIDSLFREREQARTLSRGAASVLLNRLTTTTNYRVRANP